MCVAISKFWLRPCNVINKIVFKPTFKGLFCYAVFHIYIYISLQAYIQPACTLIQLSHLGIHSVVMVLKPGNISSCIGLDHL